MSAPHPHHAPSTPITAVRPQTTRPTLLRQSLPAYALLAPALLLYLVFVGVPLLQVAYYSLFRFSGGTMQTFVGLGNYATLVRDPNMWTAFGHNIMWVALTLIFPLAAGLILSAVLIEQKPWVVTALSSLYFLPRTIPFVISGIVWGWMYNPTFGVVNWGLDQLGLGTLARAWIGEPQTALYALNVLGSWTFFGFCTLIYLSAIQNIEPALYEAANLDGATWWQKFRFITVPSLRGTTLFLALYAGIEAMRFFDIIWVTTKGGPGISTEVLSTYIYKVFFLIGDNGYAAALSVVLIGIVLVLGSLTYSRGRAT